MAPSINVVAGLNATIAVGGGTCAWARKISVKFAQKTIDVTTRASSNWGEFLNGRREWTVDIDGGHAYNIGSKKILEQHFIAQSPATLSIVFSTPDGQTMTGTGYLTSLTLNADYESMLELSCTIQGTGALVTSVS
jgi:predicted secreted protein